MIVVGYGVSGQPYDFYLFDQAGKVWDGGAWVAWVDANYQSYRFSASESGGPGRYVAEVPAGARSDVKATELRFRGPTLAGSYVVWTGEVEGSGGSDQSYTGSGIAAEIAATAAGPQSFQTDGQQAVAQPLPHLIAADQYLAKKRVTKKRGFWGQVSIAKTVPPGAVEES